MPRIDGPPVRLHSHSSAAPPRVTGQPVSSLPRFHWTTGFGPAAFRSHRSVERRAWDGPRTEPTAIKYTCSSRPPGLRSRIPVSDLVFTSKKGNPEVIRSRNISRKPLIGTPLFQLRSHNWIHADHRSASDIKHVVAAFPDCASFLPSTTESHTLFRRCFTTTVINHHVSRGPQL